MTANDTSCFFGLECAGVFFDQTLGPQPETKNPHQSRLSYGTGGGLNHYDNEFKPTSMKGKKK